MHLVEQWLQEVFVLQKQTDISTWEEDSIAVANKLL